MTFCFFVIKNRQIVKLLHSSFRNLINDDRWKFIWVFFSLSLKKLNKLVIRIHDVFDFSQNVCQVWMYVTKWISRKLNSWLWYFFGKFTLQNFEVVKFNFLESLFNWKWLNLTCNLVTFVVCQSLMVTES